MGASITTHLTIKIKIVNVPVRWPQFVKTIAMESLDTQEYLNGLCCTFDPWEEDLSDEVKEDNMQILACSTSDPSSSSEDDELVCAKRRCRNKFRYIGSICCSPKCFKLWSRKIKRDEEAAKEAYWEYLNTPKWSTPLGWHYPKMIGPKCIPWDI